MANKPTEKLKKGLGLTDIIALSTGAMFSSGFFLLPGLAANYTGPSVFAAYLLAAFFIVPAMFSIAELATAIPRAGGIYFLLDRSLGPMMGAVGGMGTYFALILKTAFALVGIGAYAALYYDVPIKTVAIILSLVFMVLNILGAKKTTLLQRILVGMLLLVLGLFLAEGTREVFFSRGFTSITPNLKPFFTEGFEGLFATAGFVFVSYLGLTQVASVAEEIRKPERNIPLGMIISLVITTFIYVFGIFIIVAVTPMQDLASDLTPVTNAARKIFKWIPPQAGLILIVIAAISAFASTGNGGLMSASRYPMAMARDRLFPPRFTRLGRFNTPVPSILFTTGIIMLIILTVSEEGIAKLASTFQLIIFILINFAVIVMRNSKIESYDPGYHSPLYPWMQVFGIVSSGILIIYMGWGPALFSAGIIAISLLWYQLYARRHVRREGAIYHWFALLGRHQDKNLENEMLHILKEKGLREGDPFDELVVKSKVIFTTGKVNSFKALISQVATRFAKDLDGNMQEIRDNLLQVTDIDPALIIPRVSILHARIAHISHPALIIAIDREGINKPVSKSGIESEDDINVFFFLLHSPNFPKQHLRLLSRLMDIVEREGFLDSITKLENDREVKEYMLHNDRFITLHLSRESRTSELIGLKLMETSFPQNTLVALIHRGDQVFTPRGNTKLKEHDIITILGEPTGIDALFVKYVHEDSV